MKLLWFLTWREVRTRWRNLLPFVLICTALFFTAVSQSIFQESVSGNNLDYMMSPTYLILLTAFSLICFVAAKTYFSLYSEEHLTETGIKRALGLKRRHIRYARLLLGSYCILFAVILAVPLALLYIYLFTSSYSSGDSMISSFVPLEYHIPVGNILRVLILLTLSLFLGVLMGSVKEKSIVSLLRRGKMPLEAENGNGVLPEEGNLKNYGRLVIRRSLKRCVKYNLITVFLLILPMFYLLGASTFQIDYSTHTYTLYTTYDTEKMKFIEITDEMLSDICGIPGISDAIRRKPDKKGHMDYIEIYTQENFEISRLHQQLLDYAAEHSIKLENSAHIREENNKAVQHYHFFFLTDAAILFAVSCITSFTLLKSRLVIRKRELSLLRAMGARIDTILSAVMSETIADYIAGAIFSVGFGALGFWGVMMDGGGTITILPIIFLCILFVLGSLYVQIHASRRMTRRILAESAERF